MVIDKEKLEAMRQKAYELQQASKAEEQKRLREWAEELRRKREELELHKLKLSELEQKRLGFGFKKTPADERIYNLLGGFLEKPNSFLKRRELFRKNDSIPAFYGLERIE